MHPPRKNVYEKITATANRKKITETQRKHTRNETRVGQMCDRRAQEEWDSDLFFVVDFVYFVSILSVQKKSTIGA